MCTIKPNKTYISAISTLQRHGEMTTSEVAQMLGVTETTVKRWGNDGLLRCVRTPGGHRKFLLRDVAAFADAHGLSLAGLLPPPMNKQQFEELALGISLHEHARIASVLFDELLQADREGVHELLTYLVTNGLALPVIVDEVIQPAFRRIGELWKLGKLGVNQEHAASYILQEALSRLAPTLHRKPPKQLMALCACPQDELHDLGLRCLSYCLELEGVQTRYLGANTPTESIVLQINELKPQLVAISVTAPRPKRQLIEELNVIAKAARSHRALYILGGSGSIRLSSSDVASDYVGADVQGTLRFIGERYGLRPGRKRRNRVIA